MFLSSPRGNVKQTIAIYTLLFFLLNKSYKKGCENPSWHADGYCDDVNNIEACLFDGGDCCGSNVDTTYCVECRCLEGGGDSGGITTSSGTTTPIETTSTTASCNQGWIGDGYCDDINNNVDCSFDGGDCCGTVCTNYCAQCLCLEDGGVIDSATGCGGGPWIF